MNMDDYERIQNAVHFIEEHLQNDLNITDIAAKSCFSPFHFQRLFQAISGFSVYQYIRNRRLSEAALLLEKTDRSILEIAIDFGYGSQEAFGRAFSQYFGITPAKYRKAKVKLDFQTKINFLEYKERMTGDMNIPKPHITHLHDIHMIGYEYRTNLNDEKYFEDIPKFYNDFGRNGYFMQIPQKTDPNMCYGLSCRFQDDGGFSFIIGEAVRETAAGEVPEPLMYTKIPGGKYAVFHVNGSTESVQNTRRYIYGSWLMKTNYERTEGPDFEVTDVCRSVPLNEMKMTIYIPLL
ncbi:AraC family transcriptional regulator [Bacillus paralicheniformis]|nr:AraC family transcriptional regulator [Bacillus paralicheniformis]